MFSNFLMIIIFSAVNGKLTSITSSNVDEMLGSKSEYHRFVKFFAPWCGHCKKMGPDWEKLAEKLSNTHKDVMIADVDCTVDKDICSNHNVEGFPTLKYFMPNDESGDDYSGNDRSFSGLTTWVEDKLNLFKCSITNVEFCTESQRSFLKELSKMSESEKSSRLKENDEKLKTREKEHSDLLANLQAQFTASSENVQSVKDITSMENGIIRKYFSESSKDEL